MFLTKIWFVLVGLALGVAATAAFVAPRSADRRIVELEGQRLDRAQYAAEQMLKGDAHYWIDYTAKLARDAVLTESLDAASRGAGEPRLLHETVNGRLKTLAPQLGAIGLDAIGAVDAKGRLVGRIGEPDGGGGEAMAGLEVIADALRGYLSDDVWGFGGKLRRVAAVPVLSKTRDRIVGAVYVAAETSKRLAEVWKKNLGVEIAVLLRGQVVSSTVPESFLGNLAALVDARKDEIAQAKRTRPIPLKVGNDRLLAVGAPFAGMAAEQEGMYVLLGKMSPASDPLALLSTTTADDLGWSNFPWLGLGIAILVVLGVGLALQRHETEKPLLRLRNEVQRLARGEIHKLQDHDYPGKFGGIARDVNAAMERYTLAAPPKTETAKKDLDAILGPAPSEPASVFDLPQSHFGNLAPVSPFGSGGAGAGAMGGGPALAVTAASPSPPPFGGRPSSPPPAPPTPFGATGPMPPAFGATAPLPTAFAPPPPAGPGPFASTPAPGAGLVGATPERRLMSPSLGAGARPPAPSRSPAPEPAPPPPAASVATLPFGSPRLPPAAAAEPPEAADELPSRPNNGASAVPPDDADYDGHIKDVFDDYLVTRQSCGEATANLSLDKFRAKLDANRQQLISKYGCRTARFSVYVKDGKAAIKATPIR
jgi:hypothetical protein